MDLRIEVEDDGMEIDQAAFETMIHNDSQDDDNDTEWVMTDVALGKEIEQEFELGPIFLEPFSINEYQPNPIHVQQRICDFLSIADLKNLRRVNKLCNVVVKDSKAFSSRSICKISDRWHKLAQGANTNGCTLMGSRWRYFEMDRFAFHRKLDIFKDYWKTSTADLIELNLTNSSFECDALSFILNHCVKLKSLKLQNLKLKHWSPRKSLVHEHPLVVAGNLTEAHEVETMNMRKAFTKLRLQNIKEIGPCIVTFLTLRSGYLESLEANMDNLAKTTLEDELSTLLLANGLVELIKTNQASLKTLSLENVVFQPRILERLGAEFPDGLSITELTLWIGNGDSSNETIGVFMGTVGKNLEKLTLKYLGKFTVEDLDNVVTSVPHIKHLKLILDGRSFNQNDDSVPEAEDLELESVFQKLTQLETIEVSDNSGTSTTDLKIARGQRETRKSLRPTPERKMEAVKLIKTPISSNFLTKLPQIVKGIKLGHVIMMDSFLSDIRNFRFTPGYQSLTKLEILGPLLMPLDKGFELITREIKILRTLTLVDVGLTDSAVTGLSPSAVREMRNSGAYMLGKLAEDLALALNCTLMYNPMDEVGPKRIRRCHTVELNPVVAEIQDPLEPNNDEDESDEEFDLHGEPESAIPVLAVQPQGPIVNNLQGFTGDLPIPAGLQVLQGVSNAKEADQAQDVPNGYTPREFNTPRPHLYHLRHLEHLNLSGNCEVTDIAVFDSIKNRGLKSLNLNNCNRITDFALEHISRYHPNLEVLDVKYCRKLSKYGLNQVIKRCSKLERIQTTKIVAETDMASFVFEISPSYFDIVRYPKEVYGSHSQDAEGRPKIKRTRLAAQPVQV